MLKEQYVVIGYLVIEIPSFCPQHQSFLIRENTPMLALLKGDGGPQIDPQSQCFRGKVCGQRIYLLSLSSNCKACLAKVMKDYFVWETLWIRVKGNKFSEVTLSQIWEDRMWKSDTEEFYLYPNVSGKIFEAECYVNELIAINPQIQCSKDVNSFPLWICKFSAIPY